MHILSAHIQFMYVYAHIYKERARNRKRDRANERHGERKQRGRVRESERYAAECSSMNALDIFPNHCEDLMACWQQQGAKCSCPYPGEWVIRESKKEQTHPCPQSYAHVCRLDIQKKAGQTNVYVHTYEMFS